MGLLRKEDMHESFWKEGVSNPNLLINGDFQINQRGKTNYTDGYTVDRWRLNSDTNAQLDVLDNCIRITAKTLGTWTNLSTRFDCSDFKYLLGKTLTLTFKLLTPTTKVNQIWATCVNGENTHHYFDHYGLVSDPNFYKDGPISIISKTFTIDQIYSDGYIEFGIQTTNNIGDSIEIEWAKLEVGELVTPFAPRPYGEELVLCQRYYETTELDDMFLGLRDANGSFYVPYHYRVEKRANPTIKVGHSVYGDNIMYLMTKTRGEQITPTVGITGTHHARIYFATQDDADSCAFCGYIKTNAEIY